MNVELVDIQLQNLYTNITWKPNNKTPISLFDIIDKRAFKLTIEEGVFKTFNSFEHL